MLKSFKNWKSHNKKKDRDQSYGDHLAGMLSVAQLEALGVLEDEALVGAWFSKKYCDEMSAENLERFTNQEKYDNLKKLYKASEDSKMPRSMQIQFLCQILSMGPKLNIYDEKLLTVFIKYMESILGGGSTLTKISNAYNSYADRHHERDWSHQFPGILNQRPHGMYEIIDKYLTHYAYQNGGDLSRFKVYKVFLTKDTVNMIEDQVRVFRATDGLKGLKLNNEISAEEFKRRSEEVIIKFTPSNSDKFKINDVVELEIELKNIKTIHYKIFEFNTLTYYRKTMKPFNT